MQPFEAWEHCSLELYGHDVQSRGKNGPTPDFDVESHVSLLLLLCCEMQRVISQSRQSVLVYTSYVVLRRPS